MKIITSSLLFAALLSSQASALDLQEFQAQTAEYHTSGEIQAILTDAQDLLMRRWRLRTQTWLNRSVNYLPLIKVIFAKRGLPEDLAYLPLIESGFNPLAISPAEAVGLWQFIEETGRRYGLKIDEYVDERKDPIKSTSAAAEYLSDLYAQFGSWPLALAAYNAGENQILRISARVGEDIWKFRYTPDETKRYVPLFVTAVAIARNPEKYGFVSHESSSPKTREIVLGKATELSKLARKYKTKVGVLRALNPALLTDATPPYRYILKVPA